MKKMFIALTLALFLFSCDNGGVEKQEGIPEIKSFRVLGDDGSGGYVEKDEFILGEGWPYLEFNAYDDELDIKEISITRNNSITGNGNYYYTFELPNQETNPQIYFRQVEMSMSISFPENYWSLSFYLTDKKGNKSKTYTSKQFKILPPL